MISRIAIASLFVILVSPMTANAQLRHRKQKDSQPSVVHLHTTTVQPVYTPVVTPVITPVFVEQVVAHTPVVSTYRPTVSYVPEPPVVSTSVAVAASPVNHIPVRTPAFVPVRQAGGQVRLTNPRDTQGTLTFTVNGTSFALNPGETRTVTLDRELVVKFDNGNSKQVAYRLTEGAYEFTVDDATGWDLVKRSSDAQAMTAALAAPRNSIPQRAPVTSLSSTDIPTLD